MTQQAKVMGNVASYAAMVENDSTWSTPFGVRFGKRRNGDVNIGFSYDGNLHDASDFGKTKVEIFMEIWISQFVFVISWLQNQCVMAQNKKRKRRNYKYHAITFKLSAGQYRSLRNYCKARRTTPIKLIKKNIERFITAYEYEVPQDLYLTENQLDLFSEN